MRVLILKKKLRCDNQTHNLKKKTVPACRLEIILFVIRGHFIHILTLFWANTTLFDHTLSCVFWNTFSNIQQKCGDIQIFCCFRSSVNDETILVITVVSFKTYFKWLLLPWIIGLGLRTILGFKKYKYLNIIWKNAFHFTKNIMEFIFEGFDHKTCTVLLALDQQSPDIAAGVHVNRNEDDIGAGDQVSCQTANFMPSSHKKLFCSLFR